MIRLSAVLLALFLPFGAHADVLPAPAEGQSWWGLGATGILCYQLPCPFNGVFPISRDGTRGRPLSAENERDPNLGGNDANLARIRDAFAAGDCVIAEGRLAGDRLVVSRILGSCEEIEGRAP